MKAMGRRTIWVLLASLAVVLAPVAAAWACTPTAFGTPAMVVSPDRGPSGTSVSIYARGFEPALAVDVHLASDSGDRTLLGSGTTDAAGVLAVAFVIPDVPASQYTVLAGASSKGTFQVTSLPQPAPVPANGAAAEPTAPVAQPAPAASAAWGPAAPQPGLAEAHATTSGDTRAPRVTLRPPANPRLAAVLGRGLRLRVGCSEGCRIDARAKLGHRTAQRLSLHGVLARRSTLLARAGHTRLVMRLTPEARAKLGDLRALTLDIVLTVTDRAGNATTVRKALNLKR